MSALSEQQCRSIETLLAGSLRGKFNSYSPESIEMPFHTRLLGKDRMALFSFIHSVNTTLGTTIFEQVAELIAKPRFKHAQRKYKVGKEINTAAQSTVHEIVNQLIAGKSEPNKLHELQLLRENIKLTSKQSEVKPTVVDFMFVTQKDALYLFDIKSAKPNIGEFKGFKQTLLQWAGIELTKNPAIDVHTLIAIPYNPYAPEPYQRWTMKGLFDDTEILVAEEFWDFIGGKGAYEELLRCFERVGIAMRDEIDTYFSRFK